MGLKELHLDTVLTRTNIAILAVVVWALGSLRYVWWRAFSRQGMPRSLPWAGAPEEGLFPRARANLRSLLGLRQVLLDGYNDVSAPHHLPLVVGSDTD